MEKSVSIPHYCLLLIFIYLVFTIGRTKGMVCPYDYHAKPDRFIQYLPDGRPHVHKCPPQTIFDKDTVCGCRNKLEDPRGYLKCPEFCDKRLSANYDNTYFEQLVNEQWVTMICAPGTAFDPECCQCSKHIGVPGRPKLNLRQVLMEKFS